MSETSFSPLNPIPSTSKSNVKELSPGRSRPGSRAAVVATHEDDGGAGTGAGQGKDIQDTKI